MSSNIGNEKYFGNVLRWSWSYPPLGDSVTLAKREDWSHRSMTLLLKLTKLSLGLVQIYSDLRFVFHTIGMTSLLIFLLKSQDITDFIVKWYAPLLSCWSDNGGTSFVLGRFESNKVHSVEHWKIRDVLAAFVPMGSGAVVGGVFVARSPIDIMLTPHRVIIAKRRSLCESTHSILR